ncbi:MAG: FkbM family methyltransferase [Pelagibacteraceae bacterium]
MKFKYKKYIFDVGANDGADGLALALNNKDFFIHAFEANPQLIMTIKKLKKKLEKRKGISIHNYQIHNYAVSNKNKIALFNISNNNRVSSLNNLSKNIKKSWPGYYDIFKVVKKIKVKVITLYDFMNKHKIKHINFLHIDTQGHDLNVLKGLKKNINNVSEGEMESSIIKQRSAYQKNHTVKDVKRFFRKTNLKIKKIVKIEHQSKKGILKNEADIFFYNKKDKFKFKINKKYNKRYYARVLNENTYHKDDIIDFFTKTYNKIF